MENASTSQTKPVPDSLGHVVLTPGVCGGRARIAHTRIRVQDIYVWHELHGQSPDEIASKFPQLSLADVYAAMTYFWDHRDEIQQQMKEDEDLVEKLKQSTPSPLRRKLQAKDVANAPVDPVSPG